MIIANDKNEIIIKSEDEEFNLSISDDYSRFLIKITSPDAITISETLFKVEENLSAEVKEKALRYREFLIDYLDRRQKKIEEFDSLPSSDDKERAINQIIESLTKK